MSSDSEPAGADLPKRRWKDILWAVQAPPDEVSGWMDWATGILYLNSQVESPEHFARILNGERTDDVRELLSTITHENVHFLQMVTTAYMYRWVCRLYERLVTAMKPLKQDLVDYIDNPDPRVLLKIERQVLDADRRELRNHLAQLDRRGPNGIAVRDLLESHAFLVEKKSHWKDLNAPGYLQMLDDEAPAPEYRAAYDLARFRLGDAAAFAWFPLIASLCLGAEHPLQAFDVVVDEMANWRLSQAPKEFDPETVRKLVATVPDMIGSVGEADVATPLHPLYTPAVLAIQEKLAHGLDMLEFFADPVNKIAPIVSDILRPMAFRANTKDQFTIFVPPEFDSKMVPALLIYSVLASRMLGPDLFEGVERARVSGYEWAARIRPDLTIIEVEPAQLQSCELGLLSQFIPANIPEEFRHETSALWGRCLLTFNLDDDAPVWTRADVRRFIETVRRSIPAFPVYLCMNPPFGMFIVWFGSLADPSAHFNEGRNLALQHPSVVELLTESIDAVGSMAEELGVPARPLIQALLTPYPHDMSAEIVDRILGTEPE